MNILLLRGFNNYFNRIVKKYSTLADYRSNSSSYLDLENINFNPNDGVATELIIGSVNQKENNAPLDWENIGTPDYLVCYENNVIKFRWFILESERTRSGQYRIALKRDVVAEHFNEIMTAPCFVEKGIISDNSDPLLFNSENMSFNQIKQSETLLKDKTGCAWIIGYVSQDKTRYPNGSNYYESTSPVATYEDYSSVPEEIIRLASVGTFQRPVAKLNTSWGTAAGRCKIVTYWNNDLSQYQQISFTNVPWDEDVGYLAPTSTQPNGFLYAGWGGVYTFDSSNHVIGTGATTLMQNIRFNQTLRSYYINNILTNGEDFDEATQNLIEAWNGRYFKHNNKIYQIKYEQTRTRYMGPSWDIKAGTTYYDAFVSEYNNVVNTAGGYFFGTAATSQRVSTGVMRISGPSTGNKICSLSWEIYEANISFIEVPLYAGDKIKTYIPADRIQACDTPMDIFAIPYSDNFEIYTAIDAETGDPDPSSLITMSKQAALQAAISLAQAGSNVYDIQILPYFPNPDMEEYIQDEQIIIPDTPFTADTHYNFFYNTADAPIGIMFWSRTSVFTVDIEQEISLPDTKALTLKKSNATDLFRLTSPNYAGSFEFSLAKSGGRITKFNADCTYKPYNPYIHVSPDLAGLYGQNFSTIDDARGLICGGDFSITKIVDQWQQYELQNKNYQNIFDRQIQNLDVNNKIAMEQQDFSNMGSILNMAAAPFSVSGLASFVRTGITNPFLSEVGAIKETDWLRRQQAETKDYTTDMYNYNLGNIKALPNALSRTAAQTNNNKIFPFVEYFTATNAEKDVFESKIKYNGMTIMKIDNLDNYSSSEDFDRVYVKGQLIKLDSIDDDFHVADTIYQEVNKGFFIIQGE